ncbi:MAG: 16S rRNA (adenine(1518)-N(6)/adenine(1519)-N(6))-dimethyltransferase, partial [Deltaproteobacteria bacterium]|nr:16S rRNA (adenine(1518)-N(6)/adenine(1519)-N(6))-dimethyltransferase [Deltaproteobacteria bacterium]
ISLVPLAAPRMVVGDHSLFERLVKASFGMRRKTLWNCLRNSGIADPPVFEEALVSCSIDGRRRGETLTLEEFAHLSRTLHSCLNI